MRQAGLDVSAESLPVFRANDNPWLWRLQIKDVHELSTQRLEEEIRKQTAVLSDLLPEALLRQDYEVALDRYGGETNGSLVKMLGGGSPDRSRLDFWQGGSIPWVRPQDMKSFQIESAASLIDENAIKNSSAKVIPKQSVLVVVRGMILARTWPVGVSQVEVAVNQDMKALIPNRGMNPEYLAMMLRSQSREVVRDIEESGHGTKRLPTDYLKALQIPLPPLDEQLAYCKQSRELLDKAENLRSRIQRSGLEIGTLMSTVVTNAFGPVH